MSLNTERKDGRGGGEGRAPARPNDNERSRGEGRAPARPIRRTPSKNSVVTKGFRTDVLFVTVCTKGREPLFNDPRIAVRLPAIWRNARKWLVGRYVIMPDHVHFMCTPGDEPFDFHRWMAYWKSMFSRDLGREVWARGCWDTQMRNARDYAEKIEYMKMNPVRKGLVTRSEDWPDQGIVNEITWHD